MEQQKKIKMMPKIDQPREKLLRMGAKHLSDRELLAILIGSGNARYPLYHIVDKTIKLFENPEISIDLETLIAVPGIGKVKAIQLLASFEFSRRCIFPHPVKINSPEDALPLLQIYRNKRQEHFITIYLNGAHELQSIKTISIGLVNRTLVHPREVYAEAIHQRSASIIVAHNHPSGNCNPSSEDKEITNRLKKAGEILGIALLDHIIISSTAHFSFINSTHF